VPLLLLSQQFPKRILEHFHLSGQDPALKVWETIAQRMDDMNAAKDGINIVICGKYTSQSDAYHSVIKGIHHASIYTNIKVNIIWLDSEQLEETSSAEVREEAQKILKKANGFIVPGGFGVRGIEGKILVAKFARENNVPYFGICLGLHVAVIEFARNVCGLKNSNSEEFDELSNKVIMYMPEIDKNMKGGTMRLGSRETIITKKEYILPRLYKKIWNVENSVAERHRHRYEVNPEFISEIESKGLIFVGQDSTGKRQEIIENPSLKYFVGVQYHPEMKSRPTLPSPPFVGLVLASAGKLENFLADKLNVSFDISL